VSIPLSLAGGNDSGSGLSIRMFLAGHPKCPNKALVLRNLQDKTSVLTRWPLEIPSYVDNLEPATGKAMQTNKKPATTSVSPFLSGEF